MASPTSKPRLRPIEAILVPDERGGRVLLLRDTEGIQDKNVKVPVNLVPVVARFDGRHTCEEIARNLSDESGESIPVALIVKIASELEESLFCDGPLYKKAKQEIAREFKESSMRPASHAGGAYYADAERLSSYIDSKCIEAAAAHHGKRGATVKKPSGRVQALVSPHIDPWRGAVSYGHAYGFLRDAIHEDVDTFVVFGTSHAPMKEPFALCRKSFATPFGAVKCDESSIDTIASAATFDVYRDELNHKREHSIEFQAVFLKHVMGARPFRIIPILAGLGEHQAYGKNPAGDPQIEKFLDAVRAVVQKTNALVVAGADLAHVGPRFGDPAAYDVKGRKNLDETDRASIDLAVARDAGAFWENVAKDLDTRRVCGLGPMYSLLRVTEAKRGELLHYEQTVDPDEGSIVSHAAIALME